MNKTIQLRPRKSYGKSLRLNPEAINDMIARRLLGETYKEIGEAYGVSTNHAWTVLNKN